MSVCLFACLLAGWLACLLARLVAIGLHAQLELTEAMSGVVIDDLMEERIFK